MNIRKASVADLPAIMNIYAYARNLMKKRGNPMQWKETYPDISLIESDIKKGECFVGEGRDKNICCVFAFILGQDPTYDCIYNGQWLNNEPYGTIHRIASNGQEKNVFSQCVNFCTQQISNVRIDTHKDNHIMQYQILKNDFTYCGMIYVEDGSERLAYQWSKIKEEKKALS